MFWHSLLLVLLELSCLQSITMGQTSAMFCRSLLLVLLGLSCLQSITKAQNAKGAALCCFKFQNKPMKAANIRAFEKTRFDCTHRGVIFTTKKGIPICVDPAVDWVKQIIKIKTETCAMFCRSLLLVLLGLSCLHSFTMEQSAKGASLCCFEFHKRPMKATKIVMVEGTRFDCTLRGVIYNFNLLLFFFG
ncbi:hypothetical protein HF521_020089 [Silurus meridionalis]|uniref:Chemokine interleukin-8-like domain-containing protein n=1 Tax=Silurus meridionalis TaxID=175797 RepID=A0A8T0BIP7_SILME|nr:hypothetical protein HF521_020089 [Silurus meridionalis]